MNIIISKETLLNAHKKGYFKRKSFALKNQSFEIAQFNGNFLNDKYSCNKAKP
jgi:hypothetical protein